MTRVIDHDNRVQTNYRQTNFGYTECYCVDYVFCGEMSSKEERGQHQQQCYCTGPTGNQSLFCMCAQDAIIKVRSLINRQNLIDTAYKDIRLAIQNNISPKEKVVTAERAKLLSVIQGAGEPDDNFLARLREDVRYCDIEKLKTAVNTEEEL